ncbi:MAG: Do family serine endopeptidase [Hyphomonadaceae bacterium]
MRIRHVLFAALTAFLTLEAVSSGAALAQQRVPPASQAQMQMSFAPVAARAAPAVVNVYAQRVVRQRASIMSDAFFRQFGGVPRERIERSLGSGVIVRGDGIIVTNNHVVEGADALKVVLADRREFDATLLLADPRTDLAVLRIDTRGEQLPMLPFANTRSLQVGDLVLAIGNPFGLSQTVTSGIVSALARTEVGINDFAFFIQTDAAINRGNSGGALVDMQGELAGVNTAIFSGSGDSNGIGFAIPAEMVRRVVEAALAGGRIVRPWLGAQVQAVTQEIARSMGLDRPQGVLVGEVYPGSAAQHAGLQRGDVILSIDGADVHDDAGVRYQFATQRAGARVPVTILRGQARRTLSVEAEAAPGGAGDPRDMSGRNPLDGARVATLTPAVAIEAGLDPFQSGVVIQSVNPAGLAARAGFAVGDVVRQVNGQAIRSTADLQRTLSAARAWQIAIERNGQNAVLQFQL